MPRTVQQLIGGARSGMLNKETKLVSWVTWRLLCCYGPRGGNRVAVRNGLEPSRNPSARGPNIAG